MKIKSVSSYKLKTELHTLDSLIQMELSTDVYELIISI